MVTGTSVETEELERKQIKEDGRYVRCRGCQKCVVEMFRKQMNGIFKQKAANYE